MNLFNRKKPEEIVREWDRALNREQRKIDRELQQSKRQVQKMEADCKKMAKKNQVDAAKVLARQVIQGRKGMNRLHQTKANINSVQLNMKQQMAMAKVSGAFEKSTQVMKAMSKLVRVPEVMKTMQELQREMMKSGVIEEMMNDALDDALGDEDLEQETDDEVNKVLEEIISGQLDKMPTNSLPAQQSLDANVESEEEDEQALQERLQSLRS
ncbi:charged multivesicular body protein 3-like [Symsagittifera roscoffensis]|uniref:charged multivesicular body protein 3-like n=1 Tax=Symsagittifera roscoffensis TaxID=84072 RepID=UPI00307C8982